MRRAAQPSDGGAQWKNVGARECLPAGDAGAAVAVCVAVVVVESAAWFEELLVNWKNLLKGGVLSWANREPPPPCDECEGAMVARRSGGPKLGWERRLAGGERPDGMISRRQKSGPAHEQAQLRRACGQPAVAGGGPSLPFLAGL